VEVGPLRERRGVDLHHRPDQHEVEVGARPRHALEERAVEALVELAEEPDARPLLRDLHARRAKVAGVDAAREGVNVRVPLSLGLVEAVAAGEDDVGAREELFLATAQRGRRAQEPRQLVHAVVDHERRLEVAADLLRHRRVEPEQRRAHALARQKPAHELALDLLGARLAVLARQARREHAHARVDRGHVERRRGVVVERGLLDEEDAPPLGASGHQMLRTLKDEVPAEMRQADDVLRAHVHVGDLFL
jgi:hypothetical protein